MVKKAKRAKQALEKAHRLDRVLGQRALAFRAHPLIQVLGKLSEVGDQPPLIALSTATIVAGAAVRSPGVARTGARMLASHLLATGIKTLIKHSIDRTRPKAAREQGYKLEKGGKHGPELASFPSGHTAGAVAVARAVRHDYPGQAPLANAAAVAIGVIQLPRGKHYLSDVLVGAIIGVAAEAAVDRLARLATEQWRSRTRAML
jgi:undecaprenyl-diphosphatase